MDMPKPEEIGAGVVVPSLQTAKRKVGRPKNEVSYEQIKKLKKIRALVSNPTLVSAYREVYPKATEATAKSNAHNTMLRPDVFAEVIKLLSVDSIVKANKDVLEKVLFMVIARWMSKTEKTSDMIAAVRELTKLVPEFSDKLQVEDITTADEAELDRKLRSFGYDPSRLSGN